MDFGERVDALERLSKLHASGALTGDEYLEEKHRLFSGHKESAYDIYGNVLEISEPFFLRSIFDKIGWSGAIFASLILIAGFGLMLQDDDAAAIPSDSAKAVTPEEIKAGWSTLSQAVSACSDAAISSAEARKNYQRQMRPLSAAVVEVGRQTGSMSSAESGSVMQPYIDAQERVNAQYNPIFGQLNDDLKKHCSSARDFSEQFARRLASNEKYARLSLAAESCGSSSSAIYDGIDLNDAILERRHHADPYEVSRNYKLAEMELPQCLSGFRDAVSKIGIGLPAPRFDKSTLKKSISDASDTIRETPVDWGLTTEEAVARSIADEVQDVFKASLSAQEQKLVDDYFAVVKECRGGSTTSQRCQKWGWGDVPEEDRMNAAGICFGRADQSYADYRLHRCGPTSNGA